MIAADTDDQRLRYLSLPDKTLSVRLWTIRISVLDVNEKLAVKICSGRYFQLRNFTAAAAPMPSKNIPEPIKTKSEIRPPPR